MLLKVVLFFQVQGLGFRQMVSLNLINNTLSRDNLWKTKLQKHPCKHCSSSCLQWLFGFQSFLTYSLYILFLSLKDLHYNLSFFLEGMDTLAKQATMSRMFLLSMFPSRVDLLFEWTRYAEKQTRSHKSCLHCKNCWKSTKCNHCH